jgi:hypothetical protein
MKGLILKVCKEVVFKYDTGAMIAETVLAAQPGKSVISNPLDLMDGLARQMQSLISEAFKYQSGVGLDLLRQSLNAPFKLKP